MCFTFGLPFQNSWRSVLKCLALFGGAVTMPVVSTACPSTSSAIVFASARHYGIPAPVWPTTLRHGTDYFVPHLVAYTAAQLDQPSPASAAFSHCYLHLCPVSTAKCGVLEAALSISSYSASVRQPPTRRLHRRVCKPEAQSARKAPLTMTSSPLGLSSRPLTT